MQETSEMGVQSLGLEDPLEKERITHSWSHRLQSIGSQRVGQDWGDLAQRGTFVRVRSACAGTRQPMGARQASGIRTQPECLCLTDTGVLAVCQARPGFQHRFAPFSWCPLCCEQHVQPYQATSLPFLLPFFLHLLFTEYLFCVLCSPTLPSTLTTV